MVFIVADKDKYVMLSDNHSSIKLKKGEACEIDEVNAKFLTERYSDIVLYNEKDKDIKKQDKDKKKKDNQEESLNTLQDNNVSNEDNDVNNEANQDNK